LDPFVSLVSQTEHWQVNYFQRLLFPYLEILVDFTFTQTASTVSDFTAKSTPGQGSSCLYLSGVRCSPKIAGPRMQSDAILQKEMPIPFFLLVGGLIPIVSSKDSWQAEAQEKWKVVVAHEMPTVIVDKRVRCSAGHNVPILKLSPTACAALYKPANPVMWSHWDLAQGRLVNPTLLLKVANGNLLHGFWSSSISTFGTGSRIGTPWLLTEYDTKLQKARESLERCRIVVVPCSTKRHSVFQYKT
jgi:hypothetical protein